MKQTSFDATISALDVETSLLDAETSSLDAETSSLDAVAETSALDAETSALDAETSALGAATSVIARSYRRYRRGVSGDCGVGMTPQMCNRVTNRGDMSTFSKPAWSQCFFHSGLQALLATCHSFQQWPQPILEFSCHQQRNNFGTYWRNLGIFIAA